MPSASNSDHDGRYIKYDTFVGDVYTLDTAGITLTAGTLTAEHLRSTDDLQVDDEALIDGRIIVGGGDPQAHDLLTNGSFRNGSTGWTAQSDWSFANGKATWTSTGGGGGTQNLSQNYASSPTAGELNTVKFELSNLNLTGGNRIIVIIDLDVGSASFAYTTAGVKTISYTVAAGRTADRIAILPEILPAGDFFTVDWITSSWSGFTGDADDLNMIGMSADLLSVHLSDSADNLLIEGDLEVQGDSYVQGFIDVDGNIDTAATLTAGTITDGTLSINSGSITSAVNGTFSTTLSAATVKAGDGSAGSPSYTFTSNTGLGMHIYSFAGRDTLGFSQTIGSDPAFFIDFGHLKMGSGDTMGSLRREVASATNPNIIPRFNDDDTGIGRAAADQLSLIAGGVEGIRITETGSNIGVDVFGTITTTFLGTFGNLDVDTLNFNANDISDSTGVIDVLSTALNITGPVGTSTVDAVDVLTIVGGPGFSGTGASKGSDISTATGPGGQEDATNNEGGVVGQLSGSQTHTTGTGGMGQDVDEDDGGDYGAGIGAKSGSNNLTTGPGGPGGDGSVSGGGTVGGGDGGNSGDIFIGSGDAGAGGTGAGGGSNGAAGSRGNIQIQRFGGDTFIGATATRVTIAANGDITTPGTATVAGFHSAITTKTNTDYTATANDDVILVSTGGTTRTISFAAAAGLTGKIYHIKKIDSGVGLVTLDPNGSETIDGDTTPDITAQFESFTIVSDGSNWHVI